MIVDYRPEHREKLYRGIMLLQWSDAELQREEAWYLHMADVEGLHYLWPYVGVVQGEIERRRVLCSDGSVSN